LEIDKVNGNLLVTYNTTGFTSGDLQKIQLYIGDSVEGLLKNGAIDDTQFNGVASDLQGTQTFVFTKDLTSDTQCAGADTYSMSLVSRVEIGDASSPQIAYLEDNSGVVVDNTYEDTPYLAMSFTVDCMCKTLMPTPEKSCLMAPSDASVDAAGNICYKLMEDGGAEAGEACVKIREGGDLDVTFNTAAHGGVLKTAQLYVGQDVDALLSTNGQIDVNKFTSTVADIGAQTATLSAVLSSGDKCALANTYTMSIVGRVVITDATGNEVVAHIDDSQGGLYLSMIFTVDCMCQSQLPIPSDTCIMRPASLKAREDGYICYALRTDGTGSADSTSVMAGEACLRINAGGNLVVRYDTTAFGGLHEAALYVGDDHDGVLDANGNVDTTKFTTGKSNMNGQVVETSITALLASGDVCAQADSYPMALVGRVVVSDTTTGQLHTAYMEDVAGHALSHLMTFSIDCECKGYLPTPVDTCLQVPDGITKDTLGRVCYGLMKEDSTPAGEACLKIDEGGDIDVTYDISGYTGTISEAHVFVGPFSSDLLTDGTIDASKYSVSKSFTGTNPTTTLKTFLTAGDLCAHAGSYTMAIVGQVVIKDGGSTFNAFMESDVHGYMEMDFSVDCMCQKDACTCDQECYAETDEAWSVQLSSTGELDDATCETAFAYFDSATGKCFNEVPGNGAMEEWGWTIGPLSHGASHTFTIYAGASGCDVSKGINVGNLTFSYTAESLSATYVMEPGYDMRSTHFYVGPADTKPMPSAIGTGGFTANPGLYTAIHDYQGLDASVDTFSFGAMDGPVNIIAHAVTCGIAPRRVMVPEFECGCICKPAPPPCECMDGCWESTVPPTPMGCESAYAYDAISGLCYGDLGADTESFGYSIGPLDPGTYTYEIYTGAVECNPANGVKVGDLTVEYTCPPETERRKLPAAVKETTVTNAAEAEIAQGYYDQGLIKDYWTKEHTCSRCDTPGNEKVRICHGTSSHKNPWVSICVDENALDLTSQDHRWGETHGTGNHIYPDGCPGDTFFIEELGEERTIGPDCGVVTPQGDPIIDDTPGPICVMTATYTSLPAYVMDRTEFFVGELPLPKIQPTDMSPIGSAQDIKDYWVSKGCSRCDTKGNEKIRLCHGTSSDKNPYVSICVDENSLGLKSQDHRWGETHGTGNHVYPDGCPGNTFDVPGHGPITIGEDCSIESNGYFLADRVEFEIHDTIIERTTDTFQIDVEHSDSIYFSAKSVSCDAANPPPAVTQDQCNCVCPSNQCECAVGCTRTNSMSSGNACESAFAYDPITSMCFDILGVDNSGWSIGPIEPGSYSYEIYSGAEKCDPSTGELIGNVDVVYECARRRRQLPAKKEPVVVDETVDIKAQWVAHGCSRCDTPGNEKIQLCHGTSSAKNPYVVICVD
jgi:hypothetical protein